MVKWIGVVLVALLILGCKASDSKATHSVYTSETLLLTQLTPKVYQHTSYLQTQSFGKVACNGMVVIDQNEAVIFDTPADAATSLELIAWVEQDLKYTIKAIIPTHFHADCLGGLAEFHKKNIPSYANTLTITLAAGQQYTLPQNSFEKELLLMVGNQQVVAAFIGEGHTRDNIIGHVPQEKVLFGGCLVKEMGAGKGNLEDANVAAWPATMETLKQKYPEATLIIPGHGKAGDRGLLGYTQNLFAPQNEK
jgi:metallo-beta-lactamase class B